MGDEEGGEGHGTVLSDKAAGGTDMVFVGAVEAFDELLEGAKLPGDLVAIFQTDHLQQGKRGLGSGALGVEEMHAGWVGRVAIGDEAKGLIFGQGASGFAQGHGGGQGITLRCDVIGRDVMPLGVEKEEGVLVLARHANIGFVPGGGVAERGFVAQVKGVAVVSGGLGVVEDGLVAEGHAKDLTEDLSGLASRKGKGDVEG